MIESGVVVGLDGLPIHWHLPPGRTGGSLPDSRDLWEVLWETHKDGNLLGFAHSHPGSGVPGPSHTDITTFAAVEAALGCRLLWWITSSDHLCVYRWRGPDKWLYSGYVDEWEPAWVPKLRELSGQGELR